MAYQTWLADVVADAFRGVSGFRVDTYSGWQTRGNPNIGPVGVMNHHTGPGGYDNLLNYMMRGSSIAPLCNIATSRPINGIVRITICSAGRANHAGKGNLTWTGYNNGNARSIGIENHNSGNQAWPDQQVDGIRILTAALLDRLGVNASRAVDHKTYAPKRKVDRFATNVSNEQAIISRIMKEGVKKVPCNEQVLRRGDSGGCVKKVQTLLNEKGHNAGAADGGFGPNTERAVKSLQSAMGLSTDGVVGSKTWAVLESKDEWEVFWMSLNDNEKKILKDFIGAIESEGTNAASFVKQLLVRHRKDIPELLRHVEHVDGLVEKGQTSLQGVIVGGVNAIDALRDQGYDIRTDERTGPITKSDDTTDDTEIS